MTTELHEEITQVSLRLGMELGRRITLGQALTAMVALANETGPAGLARLVPEGRRRQQG